MTDLKLRRPDPFVFGLTKVVLFTLYRLFFDFKIFGSENVPDDAEGRGIIFAPNHASYLDPPIIGISTKVPVTYLAKEYLFKPFLLGWWLNGLGVLPIKSEKEDFKSIRDLIRILHQGHRIVVFPEGTRTPDGGIRGAESGIGFLAIKSKACVVPVYIEGTFEAFPRSAKFFKCSPVRVYYGTPFIPETDKELMGHSDPYAAVGQKIMAEIKRMQEKVHSEKIR